MRTSDPVRDIVKKVPVCNSDVKVETVKARFLEQSFKFESVDNIYVVTRSNKLKGVLSVRQLFNSPDNSFIREHMRRNPVKAHPNTDKEKIAQMALKHSLKSIPVVNENNVFKGVVPSNQILKILHEEANEDFMLMSGIAPTSRPHSELSTVKSFISRIPWIIIGLFGGLLTAQVIGSFESVLEERVILAAFIPLVAYIANAVGVQTQTLYIRKIAGPHNFSIISYGLKQMFISTMIGAVWSIIITGISWLFWGAALIGAVVGIAVFFAIIVATIFAIGIPYILEKLEKDPAVGSGPFSTIIQDLLSIVIYFSIASILLL